MPSATTIPDPTLSDSDTSDSDFAAPVSASDTEGPSSSNEEGKPTKKRRRIGADEALASGDEGVVESGRRKRRRKQKKGKVDEGGQGDRESDEGVGVRLKRRREVRGERRVGSLEIGGRGEELSWPMKMVDTSGYRSISNNFCGRGACLGHTELTIWLTRWKRLQEKRHKWLRSSNHRRRRLVGPSK